MAKLTTKERKALPKKEFALPGKKAYPIPDKNHAKVAKSRASQMNSAGKLSDSAKAKIDTAANKVLKKKK